MKLDPGFYFWYLFMVIALIISIIISCLRHEALLIADHQVSNQD